MMSLISHYYDWLHGQWPVATVEKLPLLNNHGASNIPGVIVVGDLTGIPLLKFASHTGAKSVNNIVKDADFQNRKTSADVYDLVIIGGGVSGYAAAFEAKKNNLAFVLIEANQAFSTIVNFPNKKPIYTYPSNMVPDGDLQFSDATIDKESLVLELHNTLAQNPIDIHVGKANHIEKQHNLLNVVMESGEQLTSHRVIVAIGRSGNFRKLNVPGEEKSKVVNRLIDASVYQGKQLLIVGGGDSALEAAIATAEQGAQVTVSYRKAEFSRPKPESLFAINNLVTQGKIVLALDTNLKTIQDHSVSLQYANGKTKELANDFVLLATGREAPLNFFRRSKIAISGEGTALGWVTCALFVVFIIALYDWKNYGVFNSLWGSISFPEQMPKIIASLGDWWAMQVADRSTLIGTIATSMKSRSFYYTLAYTSLIGIFGWRRIQYRKTPYVKIQTTSLFLIQLIPLFLLPEIILPWLGYLGAYDAGFSKSIADNLFPSYIPAQELAAHTWPEWGHPRAYWHAYGFILAWPLNVYNVFTPTPMMGWLIISFIQTFVIIPALIYKYGKGAYCGWICSCGALAETLGDKHRHKMLRGSFWNKMNMLGQIILVVSFALLIVRILGWMMPESWMNQSFDLLLKGENEKHQLVNFLSWKWTVDILLGGILGVGFYFKYSGRIWCRFACPLAALMHIYSRFSRFAITSEKSKCISCNQCTSVCHQGIDVMNFANKGKPMTDPQCVRCSACVQTCPTGVLSFSEIDRTTLHIIKSDKLAASPVQMFELIEAKNV
jgi:NosR/NirI family transcriptional regulator, nitrous oxide reductase regulator